jgi:hypothetical protein
VANYGWHPSSRSRWTTSWSSWRASAEKLREAAKLRSYLSAAYVAAIRARQDARGLPALRRLKVTHNPARDLVTIDNASEARERALSVAELRAYWHRIVALRDPAGALLRFHLLTGGSVLSNWVGSPEMTWTVICSLSASMTARAAQGGMRA